MTGFSGTAGVDEDGEGNELWAGDEDVDGAVCAGEFANAGEAVAGDGVCVLGGFEAGGIRSCTGCCGGDVEGCCEVGVCGFVDDGGEAGVCVAVICVGDNCCASTLLKSIINSAARMNARFLRFIFVHAKRKSNAENRSRVTESYTDIIERVQSSAMLNDKAEDRTSSRLHVPDGKEQRSLSRKTSAR